MSGEPARTTFAAGITRFGAGATRAGGETAASVLDGDGRAGRASADGGTVVLVLDGAGRAGTERHVLGLLRGLRARGVPVLLVTSQPGPLADDAVALGAAWRRCPRRDSRGYVAGLVRLFREQRPVLVHAHSGRLPSLAARLAPVPIIVDTRHGIPERLRPLYARFPSLRWWEGVKSRLAHRTLCVCEADAAWMERVARMPERLLRVVPNGIAVPPGAGTPLRRSAAREALGFTPDEPILAFVGRLVSQKAPLRVLELMRHLRGESTSGGNRWPGRAERPGGEERPRGESILSDVAAGRAFSPARSPRAVICGAGSLEPELRAAEERMGLGGSILWTGEIEDPGSVLAAADVLLLPSEWEGLPYALLESMAEGTPVLATPVGGVPEVLTGPLAAGCLPWSLETWGPAARRLLTDPTARAEWRVAAAARLSDYSEPATLKGILAAYGELGWPA
jgi:glycosyltransferase involved in cell wall biosynthesis